MTKRIIKTYADNPLHLKDIRMFPFDSARGRMLLLDERSQRSLFCIAEQMKYLAPMYQDDKRLIWIEVLRGKPSEWCSFKEFQSESDGEPTREEYLQEWESWNPEEVAWYYVMTGYYQDMHYLIISDGRWKRCEMGNRSNLQDENVGFRYDFGEPLDRLAEYLRKVVEKIRKNPDEYNRYIDEHLPYDRRRGRISMKDYRSILHLDPWKDCSGEVEAFLRRHAGDSTLQTPYLEGGMTLRRYATLWTICYQAVNETQAKGADDPLAVFCRSNSKGSKMNDYDLDSEAGYVAWEKEYYPYHCHDVVYARVHLVPRKCEGGWKLELFGELEGFKEDIIAAGMALDRNGIPFSMEGTAESILMDFYSEGEIDFMPLGGWRSSIECPSRSFPHPGEDGISEEMVRELAAATRWIPLKKVIPIEEILQEDKD